MKKILIMGGTGAMGKYLVPMLTEEDSYQVFVTSRSIRKSAIKNLIYLKGNAKDISWIEMVLQTFEFDVIFDFMIYELEEFAQRCDLFLNNCTQYFYFSSCRCLAASSDSLTENSPTKLQHLLEHPEYAIDRYGLNKAQEEVLLHESGMSNYTIIRPAMTFSSNRIQFFAGDNFDVIRASKNVPTLLPESAVNSITNLTYGKNVAKMLKGLINKPEAVGEIFHPVTKSFTWGELALIFYKVFGMTYKVVPDSEYLELLNIQDGRIFDRFRNWNISNEKIINVTKLSDADFGSLEDNLREAWFESDRDRYINSSASIAAMAQFDEMTNSQIELTRLREIEKNEYFESKNLFLQRIKVDGFLVRPNPSYWTVSRLIQREEGVELYRNHQTVTSNAWVNFRNFNIFLKMKKNTSHLLKMTVVVEKNFDLKLFFHFFGKNIMRLPSQSISAGLNEVVIPFKPEVNFYSDLAITATEIEKNFNFKIKKINIEEV